MIREVWAEIGSRCRQAGRCHRPHWPHCQMGEPSAVDGVGSQPCRHRDTWNRLSELWAEGAEQAGVQGRGRTGKAVIGG